MKFGIIGAGNIGKVISNKLVNNGHDVKMADARSKERLKKTIFRRPRQCRRGY